MYLIYIYIYLCVCVHIYIYIYLKGRVHVCLPGGPTVSSIFVLSLIGDGHYSFEIYRRLPS